MIPKQKLLRFLCNLLFTQALQHSSENLFTASDLVRLQGGHMSLLMGADGLWEHSFNPDLGTPTTLLEYKGPVPGFLVGCAFLLYITHDCVVHVVARVEEDGSLDMGRTAVQLLCWFLKEHVFPKHVIKCAEITRKDPANMQFPPRDKLDTYVFARWWYTGAAVLEARGCPEGAGRGCVYVADGRSAGQHDGSYYATGLWLCVLEPDGTWRLIMPLPLAPRPLSWAELADFRKTVTADAEGV